MSPPLKITKIAQLTGHNGSIFSLSRGDKPSEIFSAGGDGWMVRWDLDQPETGKLVAKAETQLFSIKYLPDSGELVAGDMYGGIHWVNLKDPASQKNISHHRKGLFDMLVAPPFLFTLGGEGKITRWNIQQKKALESLHLSNQALRKGICFHQDGKIIIGASDNHLYFLDMDSMRVYDHLEAHTNSIFSLQAQPEKNLLFTGGRDALLKVWDLSTHPPGKVHEIPAHNFTINDMILDREKNLLITASRDKTIKIWDAVEMKLLKVLEGYRDGGHFNSVNKLCWIPERRQLVSASDDRTLILWQF